MAVHGMDGLSILQWTMELLGFGLLLRVFNISPRSFLVLWIVSGKDPEIMMLLADIKL
ncbi:hypothetical protein GLYMA_18G233900v4 [Glycine max]|uniref:Uncharacterized protein n=1 Tax=Glycine max TaxID=3847 RepID=K7MUB2_SOYBN|nr:hypothetical protein JHK85_052109 [Glycine max]KAH1155828.1 hypothetical protein GYH30_050890 [Glycine max]KRH00784.1 hypothetical protein GLYMA_18G233900v4 [Glycine max]